jgi:hypothetical protein
MLNSFKQPDGYEAKLARQQEQLGNQSASVDEPPKRVRKTVDPQKNNQLRQKVQKGKQSRSEKGM